MTMTKKPSSWKTNSVAVSPPPTSAGQQDAQRLSKRSHTVFDLGMWELMLVGLVALLVLGPEKLPKAARMAGYWVRRARQSWYAVRSEIERELAADNSSAASATAARRWMIP